VLETVSQGFKNASERLSGLRELGEENVDQALRDVQMSLLEADVDFGVVKDFLARVKERTLGEKIRTRVRDASGRKVKITPGQHFISICERELTELMGPVDPSLAKDAGAVSVMLVGLQGVGKTTVAAKLARHLQKRGLRPLLVAADVYRPAAVEQLQTLGGSIEVPVHVGEEGQSPPEICQAARARARNEQRNAIIYDTAGRLAIDDELMTELEEIVRQVSPANTLLVCDALMGRDAVNVAKTFAERIELGGIFLTKLDGDARGGAALAVKAVTGIPIKFLGTGESLDKLEEFRPEGLASRILGMGDIVGLVKDFEEVVDEAEAEADAERILKGQFTLEDLVKQLKTIQKMGSLTDLLGKMPGLGAMADQVDEREMVKVEALIGSMTREERRRPHIIDRSRASRIAQGSGRKQNEVHDLVKRFDQMQNLMATLGGGGGGLLSKVPGLGPNLGNPAGLGALGGGGAMGVNPAALMGGDGAGRRQSAKDAASRKKNKRKQTKKSRRKGRR
jgi:signal recognition particle subunit SRP54